MNHFEDIWNIAEKVSEVHGDTSEPAFEKMNNVISQLKNIIKDPGNESTVEAKKVLFGEILFHLCTIARENNINSASALVSAIDDIRSEIEDP